jgi:hypothetical protein
VIRGDYPGLDSRDGLESIATVENGEMIDRNPCSDPQPGDELSDIHYTRRVVQREAQRVLLESWGNRYWMSLRSWQKWCGEGGAKPAAKSEQR